METRFFDYNATTPLCSEAKVAWNRAADDLWLNPSSPYRAAARVHAHLEQARERLAAMFEVEAERIVFNSGATEGNNAVFAFWSATLPDDAVIGVSPTEHPSVIESAKCYFGARVQWLTLDANGAVDLASIDFNSISALSVMAANNETGVLNPWQGIAAAAGEAGIPYHCDASQWIGKMPLQGLGSCAYVTACAHKFGGPRGVGFWLLPDVVGDFACFAGGAQESGHRAGTEDVPGVLAMVAALEVAASGQPEGRDAFIEALPEFEVIGLGAERLWNTVMLLAPEFASTRWIRALEKKGFWISAGSACSTGKAGPSHVLAAMGLDSAAMQRVLRISSGPAVDVREWVALAAAIRAVYQEFKAQADDSSSSVISI